MSPMGTERGTGKRRIYWIAISLSRAYLHMRYRPLQRPGLIGTVARFGPLRLAATVLSWYLVGRWLVHAASLTIDDQSRLQPSIRSHFRTTRTSPADKTSFTTSVNKSFRCLTSSVSYM
jgi:hypothetical protein